LFAKCFFFKKIMFTVVINFFSVLFLLI
jgi:hypothetical protein